MSKVWSDFNRFRIDCQRIQQNDPTLVERGQISCYWKHPSPTNGEAYLALGRALRHNTHLHKLVLDFSNVKPQHGFAHALATGIRESHLRHVELHHVRLAPFWIIYRHGISHSQTVQELVVSFKYQKHKDLLETPDEEFPAAPSMIRSTSLRRLTVEFFNNMTEADAVEMATAIRESQLTHLVLKGSSTTDFIFKILYESGFQKSTTIRDMGVIALLWFHVDYLKTILSSLQRFQLNSFGHDSNHFQVLLDGLGSAKSLHTLEVVFGIHFARELLVKVLSETSSITSLQISQCPVDDELVAFFVEHWRHDSPLRKLSLRINRIGPAGALMLLRAVANHPALEVLDLSGNHKIGIDGMLRIAQELPNLRLRQFSVQDCLQMEWNQDVAITLINGLESNTHMFQLDMLDEYASCYVYSLDNLRKVTFFTTRNKFLHYLVSEEYGLPQTLCCHVFVKFNTMISYLYMLLQEHPTLFLAKPILPPIDQMQPSEQKIVQRQADDEASLETTSSRGAAKETRAVGL